VQFPPGQSVPASIPACLRARGHGFYRANTPYAGNEHCQQDLHATNLADRFFKFNSHFTNLIASSPFVRRQRPSLVLRRITRWFTATTPRKFAGCNLASAFYGGVGMALRLQRYLLRTYFFLVFFPVSIQVNLFNIVMGNMLRVWGK
jgi:hypothetical protein